MQLFQLKNMNFVFLIGGILLLSHHVASQTITGFPSDVTVCYGEEARFYCFVEFTSGTPSGARWLKNEGTDVSSLSAHVISDNSSDSTSLPTIVNNTLLITNVSAVGIESGDMYRCEQGGEPSDPATLTIAGLPTGIIVPGVSTTGSGSPNSIFLVLSYSNLAETITGINITWTDSTGSSMGSKILDPDTTSYTITGLNPSTRYNITLFAINQCGNGPVNIATDFTEGGSNPNPTMSSVITVSTSVPRPTPSESPGSAVGIKFNMETLVSLIVVGVVMVII